MKVRTRIAPSPTGFAHVGTAWMAIFNFAFAKTHKGEFLVRIDDTDKARHVEDAEKQIYDGLKWLGIKWDGKLGRQSEKSEVYKKYIKKLLDAGKAYEDDGAIRFRSDGEDITWKDLVRGEITFPGSEVTDFVIQRSDGSPIYGFASTIDDIEAKITHVIRGEEHISNTPRHIALIKALGEKIPEFAHLPTLRNSERKKLSKRRDPVDLMKFKREGYLPEALVNFLCLLGWSHPDKKEIFSFEEFLNKFDLSRMGKSGAIFDTKKLDWMNGEYIRKLEIENFKFRIKKIHGNKYEDKLDAIAPLVQQRIKTLGQFSDMAEFYIKAPDVDLKLFGETHKIHIKAAHKAIENIDWNLEDLNKALMGTVEENNYHTGKFFMDLRIAITGRKVTPPLNESMIILGKEEVLDRLKKIL